MHHGATATPALCFDHDCMVIARYGLRKQMKWMQESFPMKPKVSCSRKTLAPNIITRHVKYGKEPQMQPHGFPKHPLGKARLGHGTKMTENSKHEINMRAKTQPMTQPYLHKLCAHIQVLGIHWVIMGSHKWVVAVSNLCESQ